MKNKKAISFLFQIIIEILIITIVFALLAFFVVSSQGLDTKKVALSELSFFVSMFDDVEVNINSSEFNVSELSYETNSFVLSISPIIKYRSPVYVKKEIDLIDGNLRIK
ncbi:MAG: hypothetical protein QW244_01660 [Candidatus Pacearchaeota archaeon]